MNELRGKLDFEWAVSDLKEKLQVVSGHRLPLWEHKAVSAVQRLPYLRSVGKVKVDDQDGKIMVKALLKGVPSNLESVKLDFRNLIRNGVVGNRPCQCVFVNTNDGFDLHLVIQDPDDGLLVAQYKVEAA